MGAMEDLLAGSAQVGKLLQGRRSLRASGERHRPAADSPAIPGSPMRKWRRSWRTP